MRDNPPPYLRHTAWSGILQRFFALALVLHNSTFISVFLISFLLKKFFLFFFIVYVLDSSASHSSYHIINDSKARDALLTQ